VVGRLAVLAAATALLPIAPSNLPAPPLDGSGVESAGSPQHDHPHYLFELQFVCQRISRPCPNGLLAFAPCSKAAECYKSGRQSLQVAAARMGGHE
jgi:hypothetical protein